MILFLLSRNAEKQDRGRGSSIDSAESSTVSAMQGVNWQRAERIHHGALSNPEMPAHNPSFRIPLGIGKQDTCSDPHPSRHRIAKKSQGSNSSGTHDHHLPPKNMNRDNRFRHSSQTKRASQRAKRRKPRRKKGIELSSWHLHYRYLTRRIHPIDILHRNDKHYRKLWLIISRETHFQRDPVLLSLLRRRLAYISLERKRIARERHLAQVKLSIKRKRQMRLFKVAYLRFKKGRIEWLSRLNLLKKAYAMGWTAAREWNRWKQLLPRKIPRRKRKRRDMNLILDEIQLKAEMKMFERSKE